VTVLGWLRSRRSFTRALLAALVFLALSAGAAAYRATMARQMRSDLATGHRVDATVVSVRRNKNGVGYRLRYLDAGRPVTVFVAPFSLGGGDPDLRVGEHTTAALSGGRVVTVDQLTSRDAVAEFSGMVEDGGVVFAFVILVAAVLSIRRPAPHR
jgi:hypothetical protein